MAVLATVLLLPGSAGAASFNIASETYYTLDVAAGRITTRMEAEVGSANAAELKSVVLVAMPGATNITVTTEGGAALQFKATPANLAAGVPTLLAVTLEKPLKGALRANLVLTYDIPRRTTRSCTSRRARSGAASRARGRARSCTWTGRSRRTSTSSRAASSRHRNRGR